MNETNGKQPYLYSELAGWWPLLSDPQEYAEEAQIYTQAIRSNCNYEPLTLLELGSGGGNNASHMKKHFQITLVDLSEDMLRVSRVLNPECHHYLGDMRTFRLDRLFDAVFIHDAICYMTSLDDLKQAIQTAYVHCRPGGAALFTPDWTVEGFKPGTSHGGHDRGERGARYLEWSIDHDPGDHLYNMYMIYLLREGGSLRASPIDTHQCGLFTQAEWLHVIKNVGFQPKMLPFQHSELAGESHSLFLGLK